MTDAHSTDPHWSESHHAHYRAVFFALCGCTLASVVFDLVPLTKGIIAVLVLAVAVAKAQFVMRYFMHLKFEGNWKYVLLLPTAILACGIPLALAPDISLHYYTPVTPQAQAVHDVARGEHGSTAHEAEGEPGTSAGPAEH
jgi:cytochrome c oxidase subunit 4